MSYIGDNIGLNIRVQRNRAGFNQSHLAEALGVCQTAISRFEKGQRNPSINMLKRIAAALGCSFGALVNEKIEKQEENSILSNNAKDSSTKNQDDLEKDFLHMLLTHNPNISKQMRSLNKRSKEMTPEDWKFLTDHIAFAFGQVEVMLDYKKRIRARKIPPKKT